jgi:hypothetical protein
MRVEWRRRRCLGLTTKLRLIEETLRKGRVDASCEQVDRTLARGVRHVLVETASVHLLSVAILL